MGKTPSARLVVTALSGLPTIRRGDDLAVLALSALADEGIVAEPGDILVFAQKIVSKAEGRIVALSSVAPSDQAQKLAAVAQKDARLVELILQESQEVLRCRPGVIVVRNRNGFVMANAGIDASNVEEAADETVLLLPVEPDKSAAQLRTKLLARTGVAMGVIINDSIGRAWRLGTIGTAVGVSGLPALLDLRGRFDRNGRPLLTTELGAADEAAAAASLMMGQAGEGRPVVHVRGFPYGMANGSASDLVRPLATDLFR